MDLNERLIKFIEEFKNHPSLSGVLDDYVIRKIDDIVEIRTVEEEWYGPILKSVTYLSDALNLQYFIDKKTFSLVVH